LRWEPGRASPPSEFSPTSSASTLLNGGKGVELRQHLKDNSDHYDFDVIDAGPDGIIRIGFRSPWAQ
jgi:hypothetical protein